MRTMTTTRDQRKELESLSGEPLERLQLGRLNHLLSQVLPHNRFYANKFDSIEFPLGEFGDLSKLPFTFKDELVEGGIDGEFAANLTFPVESYSRFHRTSGTRGKPMVVLDTPEDWKWWMESWQHVLDSAEINIEDRVLMAFSFGPFIGFWSAHDAVVERGALVIPGGGLSTLARLDLIRSARATAIFATPSYAMHMAQVAEENSVELADFEVQRIIVAGEPGGSVPAIRSRIESAWNAKVVDHSGASEIGPWGFADPQGRGMFVNEAHFLPEFLSLETGKPAKENELSELVLTTLGRAGCPVVRYRTGDLVRPVWSHDFECRFVLLDKGVLGRIDDMMVVRGVNIFPSSIEQVLRSFPEVIEYRMTAFKRDSLDELLVEVEDRLEDVERIAKELQIRIGLRIDVKLVPVGTLPRFDAKGKRFVDNR